MKRFACWTLTAVVLMIGCPWLAVTFAGDTGMAIAFLLFFCINPIFSMMSGIFAGRCIKELWALPILVVALYLAGVWLFFDMGETAFLWYGACYFIIAVLTMLICFFTTKRSK